MDNTLKFTGKAAVYAKARPNYAPEFIDYLYKDVGMNSTSVIADIGSGTGILSKSLLERGSVVYCVEPNNDMRETAEKNLSGFTNFHSVMGTAESTTLPADSVDFIVVAQAFHWFDVENFKVECQRILKPNGKVILVWNSRVITSELTKENALIFSKYCPNFVGFSGGAGDMDDDIAGFFNDDFELRRFSNDLQFDKTKFIERCLSASYSLKETDSEYKSYISELEALFDKYSVNNILTMPNETVAYIGKV
jgi:SAM-dependent methyltransferase